MTSNLDEKGLRSIVAEYDLFFIDIWGVLHNGLNLFQNSVEVLEKLEKNNLLNQNNIKKYFELKNKLKPLCNNLVDFGNYFSENVELD